MKKLNSKSIQTDIHDNSLIVVSNTEFLNEDSHPKLAIFDLDHTLIKPQAYRSFPMNASDWLYVYPNIKQKLKELHKKNYLIFVVSNQLGIGLKRVDSKMIIDRVINFIEDLSVPIMVLMATKEDYYRKPSIGCFDYILSQILGEQKIHENSFFCGDAAGRQKDFSPSDLYFAQNCGLMFKTPEEIFLGEKQATNFSSSSYQPQEYQDTEITSHIMKTCKSTEKVCFLVMGPPFSGKGSFIKDQLSNISNVYRINDEKSFSIKSLLKNIKGNQIVIEYDGRKKKSRKMIVESLKQKGYQVTGIYLNQKMKFCLHIMAYQKALPENKKQVTITKKHIKRYFDDFQKLDKNEGYDYLMKTRHFLPSFSSNEMKKYFYHKYVENQFMN